MFSHESLLLSHLCSQGSLFREPCPGSTSLPLGEQLTSISLVSAEIVTGGKVN